MVHLSLKPFVEVLRVYDQPDGYERRLPYRTVITVTNLTETTVYVSAAVGEVTRESMDAFMALLRSRGVTTMLYERHGRVRSRAI